MANNVGETNAVYISKINLNNTLYTINDEWVRAEVEDIKQKIAGGVHFRGVSQTAIADGDALKDITVPDGQSGTKVIAIADQEDGDLFIYSNGTKNLEFVVSDGHYSEFGSTGSLGAFAFANSGAGSVEVPLSSAISMEDYTPQVSKGTMEVTTTTDTIEVTLTDTAASGTFSPANITVADASVTIVPTTNTFTALKDVTYNGTTKTLSISDGTSSAFWTGVTSATAAGQTVMQTPNQAISVTYSKATAVASKTFLTSALLNGDLAVTAVAPTITITNPTITVTVTPVAS